MEDNRIKIDKQYHQYVKSGEHYTSVSKVLEKYKQPYNTDYWSLYKAYQGVLIDRLRAKHIDKPLADSTLIKKSKEIIKDTTYDYLLNDPTIDPHSDPYEDINILKGVISFSGISEVEIEAKREAVLESWRAKRDEAILKGNTYHRKRELNSINNGYEYNPYDNKKYILNPNILIQSYDSSSLEGFSSVEEALQWNMDYANVKASCLPNLSQLPDGFYPELLIWDDEYKIAGTADKVFIETILGDRYVDIDDYKTNQSIDKKSYYTKGKGFTMMKEPVSHLMDCKHSHYHLQVSIYGYMMEKHGFIVRKVGYHHLNTLNDLPYLHDEAMDILRDYSENLNINKVDKRDLL